MTAPALFRVLTEFRFDIANAVVGSQTLVNEVGKISTAADTALNTLARLSIGFASSFGVGPTGVVGLLGQGVIAADNFNRSAIQFSSILSGNIENLQGDLGDFNKRLQFSKQFIIELSQVAFQFGLPAEALTETAKNLAGALIPLGQAGSNLANVKDLSRNLLKAAPILNISVPDVQNQLINALIGGATLQGQLFRRLTAETAALRPFGRQGGTRRFNELQAARRFELLSRAFQQFTSDASVLAAQANTLSGVFNRLNLITRGVLSIFKPLGDVVLPAIVKVANAFITLLDKQGRRIFGNLAKLIAPVADDPRGTLVNLLQFKELAADVGKAATISGIVLTIFHIKEFIKFASVLGKTLKTAFSGAAAAAVGGGAAQGVGFFAGTLLGSITKGIKRLVAPLLSFRGLLGVLRFAVTKIAVPIALLVGLFQIFSRAAAKAKIDDALRIPDLLVKLSDVFVRFSNAIGILFKPFTVIIDTLSDALVPLFSRVRILDFFINVLSKIVDLIEVSAFGFILFQAGLNGVIAVSRAFGESIVDVFSEIGRAILGTFEAFFKTIREFDFSGFFDFDFSSLFAEFSKNLSELVNLDFSGFNFGAIFDAAVSSVLEDNLDPVTGDIRGATITNQTNIDRIEIRNEFKETLEPDRIAFSLVEQLEKTAQNPTQSRGRQFTAL